MNFNGIPDELISIAFFLCKIHELNLLEMFFKLIKLN